MKCTGHSSSGVSVFTLHASIAHINAHFSMNVFFSTGILRILEEEVVILAEGVAQVNMFRFSLDAAHSH